MCMTYRDEIMPKHDLPTQMIFSVLLLSYANYNLNDMVSVKQQVTEFTPSSASNTLHKGWSNSAPGLDRFFNVKVVDMFFVTSQPGMNFRAFEFGVLRIVTCRSSTTSLKNRKFLHFVVNLGSAISNNLKTDLSAAPCDRIRGAAGLQHAEETKILLA